MQITKLGCLTSPSFEDAIFKRFKELLRQPQHHPGGGSGSSSSREPQTAASVDGIVHELTDGDDGVVTMTSDPEGNVLLPVRGVPNTLSEVLKSKVDYVFFDFCTAAL